MLQVNWYLIFSNIKSSKLDVIDTQEKKHLYSIDRIISSVSIFCNIDDLLFKKKEKNFTFVMWDLFTFQKTQPRHIFYYQNKISKEFKEAVAI